MTIEVVKIFLVISLGVKSSILSLSIKFDTSLSLTFAFSFDHISLYTMSSTTISAIIQRIQHQSDDELANSIQEALYIPEILQYTEFLQLPAIIPIVAEQRPDQTLDTPIKFTTKLLTLLATGTITQLQSTPSKIQQHFFQHPVLLRKLYYGTIQSVASGRSTLQYDDVAAALTLPTDCVAYTVWTDHALESLFTDMVYAGLCTVKLDQSSRRITIQSIQGRDILPTQLPAVATQLAVWATKLDTLAASLADSAKAKQAEAEAHASATAEVERLASAAISHAAQQRAETHDSTYQAMSAMMSRAGSAGQAGMSGAGYKRPAPGV